MPRPAALVPTVAALAAGLVVALVLLVAGLGVAALLVAVAVGAAVASFLWLRSEAVALGQVGGREVTAAELPGVHNLLDGLSSTAGVAPPRVRLVDDPAANVCTIGMGRDATLVVTSGLLDRLERIELEGVLAHELAHLRSADTRSATMAVTLGLVAPDLAARFAGERREATADAAAVTLTRYPPGLLAALEKLAAGPFEVRVGWRATRHLWLVQSVDDLTERIDTLREL